MVTDYSGVVNCHILKKMCSEQDPLLSVPVMSAGVTLKWF